MKKNKYSTRFQEDVNMVTIDELEKDEVLFSIIVPVYNLQDVVSETINCILQQTYEHFEVIVVNDGSTDNTLNVLHGFEKKDSRIKIINQKNNGVSFARNRGIHEATGDYVYFLDGDDRIHKQTLANIKDAIVEKKSPDIVAFGFTYEKRNGTILRDYSIPKYDHSLLVGVDFLKLFLLKKIYISVCSAAIKLELIVGNKIQFSVGTKHAEDIEFMVKIMSKAKNIYYTSSVYFYYIKRENSASNEPIINHDFEVYKRIDKYLEPYAKSESEQYRIYWFIKFYKDLYTQESDMDTVRNFMKFEGILNKRKLSFDKYSVVGYTFSMLYPVFLRKMLVRKYELGE